MYRIDLVPAADDVQGIIALRMLKRLARAYGLRCVRAVEVQDLNDDGKHDDDDLGDEKGEAC